MRKYLRYIYTLAILIILWQIVSMMAGNYALPGPITVLLKLVDDAGSQKYWQHIGASVFRIMAALAISFVTAVPLGLFLGMTPKIDRLAKPLIYLSYPVPKIVLLPIVLLIFGLGDLGKIVMLAMILFFQLLITTRDAARGVNRAARYSLYSLGGTNQDLFVHVIWPSCLPAVFTSLRIAAGTVVAVLFFVESISTKYGMGFYILDAWGRADIPQIFAGMVSLAVLGVILYETFDFMERIFCRWNRI
ncbi:MAG: ABC transporter permease [candidate division Zixibacteria bacterium HGW-Zixibacteria-1]|nr:MAG: ABC transporter permease [candidate division Zixibacteria bacterium HGW-Zixibacteria-1]